MDIFNLLENYTSFQQQPQQQQQQQQHQKQQKEKNIMGGRENDDDDDIDEIFIWNIRSWFFYFFNYELAPLYKESMTMKNGCDGNFYKYWEYEPSIHTKTIANNIWSELVEVYNSQPVPYNLSHEEYSSKTEHWVYPRSSSWLSSVVAAADEADTDNNDASSSAIGLLHIRRGDSEHKCNTTIPKMEKFINCTFHGSYEYGKKKNITILVGSDETDKDYLNSINHMLEKFQHVKAINFDDFIWKHMSEYANNSSDEATKKKKMPQLLNNFVLFSIQNLIRPTLDFTLELRGSGSSPFWRCNDCESELLASHLQ